MLLIYGINGNSVEFQTLEHILVRLKKFSVKVQLVMYRGICRGKGLKMSTFLKQLYLLIRNIIARLVNNAVQYRLLYHISFFQAVVSVNITLLLSNFNNQNILDFTHVANLFVDTIIS